MSKTKRTQTSSAKPYVQKLAKARELRAAATQHHYDRVKLLVEVFDDRDWRVHVNALDDLKAGEALDCEVSDLGFEFLQLRAVYQRFPNVTDWQQDLLVTLYQTVLDEKTRPERSAVRKRRVITKAEHKVVEEKAHRLECQVRQLRPLQSEVESLRERLEQAQQRIYELEAELAAAQEQLAQRELVAA